jgi:hypothetical protein
MLRDLALRKFGSVKRRSRAREGTLPDGTARSSSHSTGFVGQMAPIAVGFNHFAPRYVMSSS